MYRLFIILILDLCIFSANFAQNEKGEEMRAVWIATVKNIDFPADKFSTVEEQKKEFIEMLDVFSEIGINAVMLQVRPAADAFYASDIEPWSEWLTGKQGQAPDPYYDPLVFYIEEAHKRNIELHAWINPFRAVATVEYADISEDHISKTKAEWFFEYGIHKYFDPGIPDVREYVINIVGDIVERYDIDGVHFDDYFYPYPEKNGNGYIITIPDSDTYTKFNKDSLFIEDWRRQNMNLFIEGVNKCIKSKKPGLIFGVAPSGVWRNKSQDPEGSDTRGLAHYDYLYADVLTWLKNDWIDYVAPQIYWPIGNRYADYQLLVNWWSEHTYGKHLYIGQAVYQAGEEAKNTSWQNPNELINQLKINRGNYNVYGSIFYKAKSMLNNPLGFCDSLKNNYYSEHVSTPYPEWLPALDTLIVADNDNTENTNHNNVVVIDKDNKLLNPVITKLGKKIMLSWDKDETRKGLKYHVYQLNNTEIEYATEDDIIITTKEHYVFIERKRIPFFRKEYSFVITYIDKSGKEIYTNEEVLLKL